jgi:hypothetical protein
MQPAPPAPSSFNLEYIILEVQHLLEGLHIGGWPHGVIVLIEDVLIIGMVVTLLFIVFIVYALIRLNQVEHAGFHALEEHSHETHEPEVEATHKNDRWDSIVALAYGPSEGDWRRAILEADIMLFDVLRNNGYPGDTVGEQLKLANPIQMTTLDLAWKAHKVRNDVAHGGESYQLAERDVRATIDFYKRVFEELGAV